MARTTLRLGVLLDKTQWNRGLRGMERDVKNFSRNLPRAVFGGVAAGVGAGMGLGAIRGGIARSFETARGAQAAADLTEGRVSAGQLWKLRRDAQEKQLGDVATGGISNIARIQKEARGLDENAIQAVSRFLGGEKEDPYKALDNLLAAYKDAPEVIRREMRGLFPALENHRWIKLADEIVQGSRITNQGIENAVNKMIELEQRWEAISKGIGEGLLVAGAKGAARIGAGDPSGPTPRGENPYTYGTERHISRQEQVEIHAEGTKRGLERFGE